MADAAGAARIFQQSGFFQFGHFAHRAHAVNMAFFRHGNTGGIIPAVFQLFKSFY